MIDDVLRQQLLTKLNLQTASPEQQSQALEGLMSSARSRLAVAIAELLSESQLATLEKMRVQGADTDSQQAWIKSQLPADYDEMMKALMLDIADQVSGITEQLER